MHVHEGREYIRHPSDIPISIQQESLPGKLDLSLNNVSQGGLAFDSPNFLAKGSVVKVNIDLVDPAFNVTGVVQWCKKKPQEVTPKSGRYEVGIEYIDNEDAFRVRMIEQICHIEQYRREIERKEGRPLSGEAAALEWITKHAAEFPNPEHPKNDDFSNASGA